MTFTLARLPHFAQAFIRSAVAELYARATAENQSCDISTDELLADLRPDPASLLPHNAMECRHKVSLEQPNLSKVISALDLWLPQSQLDGVRELVGFTFASNHSVANRPSSLSAICQANGEPLCESSERDLVIAKLIEQLLFRDNAGAECMQRLANGKLDLTDQAAERILNRVISNRDVGRQINLNWLDNLTSCLNGQPKPSTGTESNEHAYSLSAAQRAAVIQKLPEVAELVSQIEQSLLLKNTSDNVSDQTIYPLYRSDGEGVPRGNMLPTFCDKVRRAPSVFDYLGNEDELSSAWQIKKGDEWHSINNKAEVVLFVAELAAQQLACRPSAAMLDLGDLLPLQIYQSICKLQNEPLPSFITESYQSKHKVAGKVSEEAGLKWAIDSSIKLEAENERQRQFAERDRARDQRVMETCRELNIPNSDAYWLMAQKGSAHTIVDDTFVTTINSVGWENEINTVLLNNHHLLDMAYNKRGQVNIDQNTQDPDSRGYERDNQCWLRASWLSVFDQVDSSEGVSRLDEGFKHARLSFDGTNKSYEELDANYHYSTSKPWLETRQIFQAYQQNPLTFLHEGEEDRLLDTPCHFRTGQSLEDCLNNAGVALPKNLAPAMYKPRTAQQLDNTPQNLRDEVVRKVEPALKLALLDLAAGVRGDFIRQIHTLMYSNGLPMAESDVPLAMHRALNLPVIVFERGPREGDPSQIRVAGPDNHPLKALETADDITMTPEKFEVLKQAMKTLPVIELKGEHYTVHVPKSGRLGRQVSQLLGEPPIQSASLSPRASFPETPTLSPQAGAVAVEELPESPASAASSSDSDSPRLQTARFFAGNAIVSEEKAESPTSAVASTKPGKSRAFFLPEQSSEVKYPHGESHLVSANLETAQGVNDMMSYALNSEDEVPLIVEFVSPRAGRAPALSNNPGLRYRVAQQLELGRPVELTQAPGWSFSEIEPAEPRIDAKPWEKLYTVKLESQSGETKTVRILELSPTFDGHSLSEQVLLDSLDAMDHNMQGNQKPILMSTKGNLRAGALSVLRAIRHSPAGQTQPNGNQQDEVNELIKTGRRHRGPDFLNNSKMLQSVFKAVQKLLGR